MFSAQKRSQHGRWRKARRHDAAYAPSKEKVQSTTATAAFERRPFLSSISFGRAKEMDTFQFCQNEISYFNKVYNKNLTGSSVHKKEARTACTELGEVTLAQKACRQACTE